MPIIQVKDGQVIYLDDSHEIFFDNMVRLYKRGDLATLDCEHVFLEPSDFSLADNNDSFSVLNK